MTPLSADTTTIKQSTTILTKDGVIVLVDLEDLERLLTKEWYSAPSGHINTAERYCTPMGRFLLRYDGPNYIDHINGNPRDNRKANLRIATPSQNGLNRHKKNGNNTSGYSGVSYHWCGRWQATFRHKYLGLFKTPEEANERVKKAKECYDTINK